MNYINQSKSENYKFLIDGSHFNYKQNYYNHIPVEEMDKKDIKIFKKILAEISEELNIVLDPLYSNEYDYWYAGMYVDKVDEVIKLMNKKGLIYE